jgi:hypothetical protein
MAAQPGDVGLEGSIQIGQHEGGSNKTRQFSRTAQVEEDEAAAAFRGARTGTDDVGEAAVVVGEDVVGTAIGQVLRWESANRDSEMGDGITYTVEAGQVLGRVKGDGLAVVNGEQLLQVEDLDVVVVGLAADHNIVLEEADLTPDGSRGASSLGQATEISELATEDDLGEAWSAMCSHRVSLGVITTPHYIANTTNCTAYYSRIQHIVQRQQ